MPFTLSQEDRRAAHAAGYSTYAFEKQVGAVFQPALVPDESGIIGAEVSLRSVASLQTADSTLYARYLGKATGAHSLNYISVITSGTPSSGVTATAGFATSPAAPDFTAKVLTFKTANTITTTGSAGVKTSASVGYAPVAGEHVWCYFHVNAGTTQGTYWSLGGEIGAGILQVKTSQLAAPTVGSSITMALPSAAVTAQSPLTFVR